MSYLEKKDLLTTVEQLYRESFKIDILKSVSSIEKLAGVIDYVALRYCPQNFKEPIYNHHKELKMSNNHLKKKSNFNFALFFFPSFQLDEK